MDTLISRQEVWKGKRPGILQAMSGDSHHGAGMVVLRRRFRV